ncbi:MAG: small basic protein [Candidatus Omnitrophica bacterium]|nr:small basic protein [Candidatus Omnitrophota bacterium]
MSQHPSLKSGQVGSKFRSVLKRYEKIKELVEKEKWEEEKDSVYKLPKIKRIKFKIKKAKGPEEEEGAEGAPEGAGAPAEAKAKEPEKKPAKKDDKKAKKG